MGLLRREKPSTKYCFTPEQCRTAPKSNKAAFIMAGLCLFLAGAVFNTIAYSKQATDPLLAAATVAANSTTTTDTFSYGPIPQFAEEHFFAETLSRFKSEKRSFIEADLSGMKIRYYKDGNQIFEAPILTKGKEGSWWETPAGLYNVELKTEKHFSSFGNVNTPWNMVFQGNFFIHGWPTYPNGTPVSSQFSGGCIRMDDKDAEALYRLVDTNTPVLVYEDDYAGDGFVYAVTPPTVDATSYIIADIKSNTILAEYNATSSVPIASLTKLMTALVASEYINLDRDFSVPADSLVNTSIPRLKAGMSLSGYSLLLPLLLESSNEAANVFGSILGKDRFVEMMNKKANSLGMKSTEFVDPSGIGDGNIASAYDLLQLATYIYHNRSFIYAISTGEKVETAYDVYPFGRLANFNPVPKLSGFVGGKVGQTTAAKETIISVYNIEIKGEERPIAFIVLGAKDNYVAVQQLHHYIKTQYAVVEED